MKRIIAIVAILICTNVGYCLDDILKLRATSCSILTGSQHTLQDAINNEQSCDILIVVTVKNSMLNNIRIYSKTKQDYDITSKVSEKISYSNGDKIGQYNYKAVSNSGEEVIIKITVDTPPDNSTPIWLFQICCSDITIIYNTK